MNSDNVNNMLFVIGACNMHKIQINGEFTGKGQHRFHELIVNNFTPTKEDFIITLQFLLDDGFIVVEGPKDIRKQQEMWEWFLKRLNNESPKI